MNALVTPRQTLDTTEFSHAGREQLPEVWGALGQPLADDNVTKFYCYSLSVPRLAQGHLPRTWLLDEIDELSERLSRMVTHFETLRGINWDLDPPEPRRGPVPLSMRALSAVRRLMDVFSMSESRVAELAGISRNSIRNWRNGQDAYPATVAHLLQTASLIAALDRSMGRDRLNTWLDETIDGSLSRRDLLGNPEGPAALAREASNILFSRPEGTLPLRELLELEPESETEDSVYAPQTFASRPRRERPNPPR